MSTTREIRLLLASRATIAVVRDVAQTFLRKGRGYRRPVVPGTFFSFTFRDPVLSLVGRVIRDDGQVGGFRRPLYLVYVYREEFGADVPPMSELVERLSPDHLLIAPQFTNRSDWWGGQFQVIGLALSVTATCFANTASAHAQGATTIATSMGARSASPWSPSDYVPSPDTTASPWQRSGHSALRPSDGRAASHLMSDHLSDGARRRFRQ